MSTTETAPKVWRGRFYEDFDVGDVFRSRLGRTITDTDNIWFTCLTMNTNQAHLNAQVGAASEFGRMLVVSSLTIAIAMGQSVIDTTQNAFANLGMVPKSSTPAELAALIKAEAATWGPIIRSTGFKPLE